MQDKQLIQIFKALTDENRVQIVSMLPAGELCACDLLEHLHITQPTLSHHMGVLVQAGLVTGRKEGKWTHYSLRPSTLKKAEQFFAHIHLSHQEQGEYATTEKELVHANKTP